MRATHLQQVVGAMKQAILADMAAGRVPARVGSYAALHDHVDANMYAFPVFVDLGLEGGDRGTELFNAAADKVDRWIRGGAARGALARLKAEGWRP